MADGVNRKGGSRHMARHESKYRSTVGITGLHSQARQVSITFEKLRRSYSISNATTVKSVISPKWTGIAKWKVCPLDTPRCQIQKSQESSPIAFFLSSETGLSMVERRNWTRSSDIWGQKIKMMVLQPSELIRSTGVVGLAKLKSHCNSHTWTPVAMMLFSGSSVKLRCRSDRALRMLPYLSIFLELLGKASTKRICSKFWNGWSWRVSRCKCCFGSLADNKTEKKWLLIFDNAGNWYMTPHLILC